MSTVTPTIVNPGDAYTAASINTSITGITDGYNALDTDDIQPGSLGVDVVHPVVTGDMLTTWTTTATVASGATANFSPAYPGAAVQTGYDKVILSGPLDISIVVGTPFEVGPASPDKVAAVLVGATFTASVVSALDEAHLALAVQHSTSGGVPLVILATDFKVSNERNYSIEFLITEDDVPAASTLEEIWLMAAGPDIVTVSDGQLWAMPIHSGS